MILCFSCSRKTKENLDELLQSGQYTDYSEIISVAVANLAILEVEVGQKGPLVLQDPSQSEETKEPNALAVTETGPGFDTKSKYQNEIPELFLIPVLTKPAYQSASLPLDVWIKGQEIPIDRWIFGQYNRLLPAKASCRALSHLLVRNKKGVLLQDAIERIAPEAAILGDYLRLCDQRYETSRDDLLSTAFPATGNGNEKSLLRYANQFIGNVNKEGQISGLLTDLKLINRIGSRKVSISLTEPGWRFATMPNPVLDGFQQNPSQKFTDEEIEFLTTHISQKVPVEHFTYRTIIEAIAQGTNTPDSVDHYLGEHVMADTSRQISQSFLSTQRSGAVSRMTDLGLIRRIRDGVKVSYEVTGLGRDYFKKERE